MLYVFRGYFIQASSLHPVPFSICRSDNYNKPTSHLVFSFIDLVQLWMKMEQMKKNGNGKSSKSPRIGLQNYRRWDLSSPALSIVDGTCWPTHLHRPLLERYSHSDDIWLFLRFCFVNTVCEYIIFRVRLAVIFKSVSTLKNTFKCF